MKTKKVLGCALALAMIASLTAPVQAEDKGWKMTGGAWNYTNEDGSLATGWKKIDGCWYEFEKEGIMKTGWVASDEKWYFLGESGVMQENAWVKSEGADYFIKGTGIMATDYIKDGYELDSTGKAIPLTQTNSVELTEGMDITDKTIEGNLYIDTAKFKELELSGITVTGKVVIMGENIKDSKITIKDSTVNTISTQTRNAEIILAGKTAVDKIQMEENSTVKPDKGYTGKVETIEIQSTAKDEIKVEVAAKTVTSNTFAPVTVNAPVDNLAVNKKTDLKVNADVSNITVNKTATDTKVEVEKNVTVGSVESETKVEVGGAGKVEDVKGDDITTETPVPEKPAGGGSSGGGGGGGNNPGTPEEEKAVVVKAFSELKSALATTTKEIEIANGIEVNLEEALTIPKGVTLSLKAGSKLVLSNPLTINGKIENYGEITTVQTITPSRTVRTTDQPKLNILGELNVYDSSKLNFEKLNDIAKEGNQLYIRGETEIVVANETYVGADGQVTLSKLDDTTETDSILGLFGRTGDNNVMLMVWHKAVINRELTFNVLAHSNDSEVHVNSGTLIQTGMLSVPLTGKTPTSTRLFPCRLYIDEKLIVGAEVDNAYIYSHPGEFNSVNVRISKEAIELYVSGYGEINKPADDNFYNKFRIKPGGILNSGVLVKIVNAVGNVQLIVKDNSNPVNAVTDDLYTFDDNQWTKLTTEQTTIKNFVVDMDPVIGEYLKVIAEPTNSIYTLEWKIDEEVVDNRETYEVKAEDIGKTITVTLTPVFPFTVANDKPIVVTTNAVVSNVNVTANSENSLYFKSWHCEDKDIEIGSTFTYEGKYGFVRINSGRILSITDMNKLTLNKLVDSPENYAGIIFSTGILKLENPNSLVITSGQVIFNPDSKLIVGGETVLETVESYTATGAPIQYIASNEASTNQGIYFSSDGSTKKLIVKNGTVHLSEEVYNKLKENYTVLADGGKIVIGENGSIDSPGGGTENIE